MTHKIMPVALGVFVFVILLGIAIDVGKWAKRRYLAPDTDDSQSNPGGEQ